MEAAQDDVQIKIGKMIFYITRAVGLWFFYWVGGIQCPCGSGILVWEFVYPVEGGLRWAKQLCMSSYPW